MGSRVVKSEKDIRITIKTDNDGRVVLVPGGARNAYLWIGDPADRHVDTICGEAALRALAKAILKEIGHARR